MSTSRHVTFKCVPPPRWGSTEGETDFSCGIQFSIRSYKGISNSSSAVKFSHLYLHRKFDVFPRKTYYLLIKKLDLECTSVRNRAQRQDVLLWKIYYRFAQHTLRKSPPLSSANGGTFCDSQFTSIFSFHFGFFNFV